MVMKLKNMIIVSVLLVQSSYLLQADYNTDITQENDMNADLQEINNDATISYEASKALWNALQENDTAAAQQAINDGADIDISNEDGFTALMFAAGQKNLAIVQELLEKGADTTARDKYNKTVLLQMSERGIEDINKALLQKDANGKPACNPNEADQFGKTPLMHAAQRSYTPLVIMLIEAGADTLAIDSIGRSALFYAREARNAGIVDLLSKNEELRHRDSSENQLEA
jgi:ankyrin repeat protein